MICLYTLRNVIRAILVYMFVHELDSNEAALVKQIKKEPVCY